MATKKKAAAHKKHAQPKKKASGGVGAKGGAKKKGAAHKKTSRPKKKAGGGGTATSAPPPELSGTGVQVASGNKRPSSDMRVPLTASATEGVDS
jgi:hypothetical protein